MLTKDQIATLRAWADVAVDDCERDAKAYDLWNPGFPSPGQTQRKIRDEWKLIGQALAAYERVAALLEMHPDELYDVPCYTKAELRRALEGHK